MSEIILDVIEVLENMYFKDPSGSGDVSSGERREEKRREEERREEKEEKREEKTKKGSRGINEEDQRGEHKNSKGVEHGQAWSAETLYNGY